jgi:cytochrome c-type biogenesis protein CcmH
MKALSALSLALVFGAFAIANVAFAAAPEVPLTDPALEARAQNLAREIRCVVCENEPVALSSADIAVDMRAAIRERVKAGDSDAQVRRFFAERYGEFVLLRPRVGTETLALWGAPFGLLLVGGGALFLLGRRPRRPEMAPDLVADEAARAAVDDEAARAAVAAIESNRS